MRPQGRRIAILQLASLASLALSSRSAFAVGTVNLGSREIVEEDGKWKLKMSIDYGSVPQLPHIAMIFSFTPTVLYELALTDKSPQKPTLNRIPLSNQQGINEPMDVGFSDGSGKTFKVTKFDFVIRRDHGFEAGEYDLKIKREDDGVQVGQVIHLVLKGDNVVVDRRAIVFSGEKPRTKKVEADAPAAAGGDDKKEDAAPDPTKTPDDADKKTGDDVPKVPPKQGGCGCEVVGLEGQTGPPLVVASAVGALALRRLLRP